MMHLYAKGNEIDTGRAAYLWGKGNYMYEIEALTETLGITKCEVFESCYEDAMKKFEKKVDKVELLQYSINMMVALLKFLTWCVIAFTVYMVFNFGVLYMIMAQKKLQPC